MQGPKSFSILCCKACLWNNNPKPAIGPLIARRKMKLLHCTHRGKRKIIAPCRGLNHGVLEAVVEIGVQLRDLAKRKEAADEVG